MRRAHRYGARAMTSSAPRARSTHARAREAQAQLAIAQYHERVRCALGAADERVRCAQLVATYSSELYRVLFRLLGQQRASRLAALIFTDRVSQALYDARCEAWCSSVKMGAAC